MKIIQAQDVRLQNADANGAKSAQQAKQVIYDTQIAEISQKQDVLTLSHPPKC